MIVISIRFSGKWIMWYVVIGLKMLKIFYRVFVMIWEGMGIIFMYISDLFVVSVWGNEVWICWVLREICDVVYMVYLWWIMYV